MSLAQLEQYASDSSDDDNQYEVVERYDPFKSISDQTARQRRQPQRSQHSDSDLKSAEKASPSNLKRATTYNTPPTTSIPFCDPFSVPVSDCPRTTKTATDTCPLQPSFVKYETAPNAKEDKSSSSLVASGVHALKPNSKANHNADSSNTTSGRHYDKKQNRPLSQSSINPSPELPAELLEELRRQGNDLADVSFINVDARAHASEDRAAIASSSARSQNPHASTVPSHVVHKTAERIAKGRGVSRLERRRHQITALAADAAALAAVKKTFPTTAGHQSSRVSRRR